MEKNKTDQELTSPRDLDGELLDAHLVPLAGRRNPRGRDGAVCDPRRTPV